VPNDEVGARHGWNRLGFPQPSRNGRSIHGPGESGQPSRIHGEAVSGEDPRDHGLALKDRA
jgi:hypothetical protein